MLNQNDSLLVMIDVQEKLTSMLKADADFAIASAIKLISAAKILNIKTVVTEQYPKGLGHTVESVSKLFSNNCSLFEKTSFSILGEENIFQEIKNSNKKQIVLFGIESHICVYQSAVELLESGFEVYVVSDATFSRNENEKISALQNLRHKGVLTPTVEMVLFEWLKTSKHPSFKEVQALIK